MNKLFKDLSKFLKDKSEPIIQYLKSGRAATSLIALIVSFSMLIVSSLAWLTTNRWLTSEDMNMGLHIDDTSAVYKVYKFDLDKMAGIDGIIDENDNIEYLTITNVEMNPYDTIFVVKNQYSPVFAQIRLTRNSNGSSMPLNGKVHITIHRDSSINPFDKDGKLSERISSVLRFTAIIDNTRADWETTDADTLYEHINSSFEKIEKYDDTYEGDESKTFITAHGEGDDHSHTKNDTITISLNYTEACWYTDDQGSQHLNLYLYMSYDKQLVDCFMKQHANSELSLDNSLYNFANDLKYVSVSYDDNTN